MSFDVVSKCIVLLLDNTRKRKKDSQKQEKERGLDVFFYRNLVFLFCLLLLFIYFFLFFLETPHVLVDELVGRVGWKGLFTTGWGSGHLKNKESFGLAVTV